jgi:hypothetical protein
VLLLVTYRPEFQPDWANLPHVTNLALSSLPRRHAMTIIEHVTDGKPLPAELVNQILARTDGIPLFVEELSKAILELGILRDAGDRYELLSPLPTLSIPDTLHNSLLARLDRDPSTKELAQIGAVIGREFAFAHLSALAPVKGDALRAALGELLRAELIHQRRGAREGTYAFKHALIQEAAYSTLVSVRRQQLHAQCAAILRELSPEMEEQQPELLAHHYTGAGNTEEAITYWLRAGRRAAERSANVEAVAHLRHGLQLVPALADPARRNEIELRLQLEMGGPLIGRKATPRPRRSRPGSRRARSPSSAASTASSRGRSMVCGPSASRSARPGPRSGSRTASLRSARKSATRGCGSSAIACARSPCTCWASTPGLAPSWRTCPRVPSTATAASGSSSGKIRAWRRPPFSPTCSGGWGTPT